MDQFVRLGKLFKKARLEKNLRMDDVAKQANISRATLFSIENGLSNCSMKTIFDLCEILGCEIRVDHPKKHLSRQRAARLNTIEDKKINRFIVMCTEQYANANHLDSQVVYTILTEKKIINELKNDYEDLHGMSFMYINDYIHDLIERGK